MDAKMFVFQCPRFARQFQPPICFPAVKQGLILELEAEKALIRMSSMPESNWRYLFQKEVKIWDSTTLF